MYKYIPVLLAMLVISGCGTQAPTPEATDITTQDTEPPVVVEETQPVPLPEAEEVTPREEQQEVEAETTEEEKPTAVTPTTETTDDESTDTEAVPEKKPIAISSAAFSYASAIPAKYTCDGTNINPSLSFGNIPEGTKSLAVLVDDPDAPVGDWVHWVLWNIDPQTKSIAANSVPAGAVQGKNDFGRNNYGGPCPPSGTHRYMFKLYALDTTLSLSAGSTKAQLLAAMNGHTLEKATLMGKYTR
jgi:Raf kinase inhibitor-like YbhB/YbcL family protein